MGMVINEVAFYIGRCAVEGLINEVCVTPKPGLVDRNNSGAHRDMDLTTFITSAAAIAPFFDEMARAGHDWKDELPALFGQLRTIGLQAEQAMFQATQGVNTHKGAIFSLGIIAAAAGYYYRTHGYFQSEAILELCAAMTGRTIEEEFKAIAGRGPQTKGERLYIRYGVKGIRGEAQSGFASVRNISLPVMRRLVKTEDNFNDILVQVLMHLMAEVRDTNVLARCGFEALDDVNQASRDILDLGGIWTAKGRQRLLALDRIFIEKNLSAGGCADLLAATVMLYLLERSA